MRHRRKGRVLGRAPSHRKALLKNLVSALFLTERDATYDDNAPKNPGQIVTTLHKAKEMRPLVEKCITIAKKSIPHAEEAEKYATDADRGTDAYKQWRKSDDWQKWAAARAPVVAAQRRVLQLIGDRQAVAILFDTIAPRYVDRPGGYTRIVRLATPRLGDAGLRAVLQLVGEDERRNRRAERPAFESDVPEDDSNNGPEASGDDADKKEETVAAGDAS
ncbi:MULTISPECIES: bL17 family ribosomal protein [Crateriforma]|uniref:Large ribosomal subunit protein bL17 n=1 Tax=Crateriforma conspicua TaxID=2527996 RepID=A0A5C6FRC8_9PLAN|nr:MULTISPECIES: L17 family ribosomal protein [Crateriforma]TWU65722.1 50S ribosomal protein L17 [Crateriforma conspicua]